MKKLQIILTSLCLALSLQGCNKIDETTFNKEYSSKKLNLEFANENEQVLDVKGTVTGGGNEFLYLQLSDYDNKKVYLNKINMRSLECEEIDVSHMVTVTSPINVCVDKQGYIYITDMHSFHILDSSFQEVYTFEDFLCVQAVYNGNDMDMQLYMLSPKGE